MSHVNPHADSTAAGATPVAELPLPSRHRQPTPSEVLSWLPRDATPAQQDSAIQAHIKPSPVTWSERPDTLHLPGYDKGHSWRDASVPLYYRESFFTGKPGFHDSLFGSLPGVAGDPVPYGIARDNTMTLILLLCFVVTLTAMARSGRFVVRQLKDFVQPPARHRVTVTETADEIRSQLFLVMQSGLLSALVYFFHVQSTVTDTFVIDQYLVIALFAGIVTAYTVARALLYWVTGLVFFGSGPTGAWLKSFLFLAAHEGVLLFPIVMLHAYFDLSAETTVVCALYVLAMSRLLSLYRTHAIFFGKRGFSLQNFLYFCMLEIVPLVTLAESLSLACGCLRADT